MITKQMLQEAIKTAHDECAAAPDGCVHADASADCMTEILEDVAKALVAGVQSPALAIYYHAMHVGYRLHQLETSASASATSTAVN